MQTIHHHIVGESHAPEVLNFANRDLRDCFGRRPIPDRLVEAEEMRSWSVVTAPGRSPDAQGCLRTCWRWVSVRNLVRQR